MCPTAGRARSPRESSVIAEMSHLRTRNFTSLGAQHRYDARPPPKGFGRPTRNSRVSFSMASWCDRMTRREWTASRPVAELRVRDLPRSCKSRAGWKPRAHRSSRSRPARRITYAPDLLNRLWPTNRKVSVRRVAFLTSGSRSRSSSARRPRWTVSRGCGGWKPVHAATLR